MDLKTAKIVAFALDAESYSGVTGLSPDDLLNMSDQYTCYETLEELWSGLSMGVAAKLRNYELVWAKQIDGLTAAAVASAPAEAKIDDFIQSAKSESVPPKPRVIWPLEDADGRELEGKWPEGGEQ